MVGVYGLSKPQAILSRIAEWRRKIDALRQLPRAADLCERYGSTLQGGSGDEQERRDE